MRGVLKFSTVHGFSTFTLFDKKFQILHSHSLVHIHYKFLLSNQAVTFINLFFFVDTRTYITACFCLHCSSLFFYPEKLLQEYLQGNRVQHLLKFH